MKEIKWNDNWLFWNTKNAFALVWNIPDTARTVCLPHDAMLEEGTNPQSPNGGSTGFYDGGSYTYVKFLHTSTADRHTNYVLRFDGIYMNAFVYVNGQLAANRPYGYSTFYVPISHLLKTEGDNEIRVQVRNSAMANSRWYSGSGIYRDVYLLSSGMTCVQPQSLKVHTESCSSSEAILNAELSIENKDYLPKNINVTWTVTDANKTIVAEESKLVHVAGSGVRHCFSRLYVKTPNLWSAETPALYTMSVSLSDAETGVSLDGASEAFGIRSLSLDAAHGLRVNGNVVKLRGACIHHDNGVLGAKTYADAEWRRVRILKDAGFNVIRMSHHPASPALVAACDQLGMYLMDETFDMWTRSKSDSDYNLFFADWWKRDVEAMVAKDYNHPSVILYSIGNEIPEIGTDAGSALAAEISDYCHELDQTRYTLASINGVFAAGDAIPEICADIAGSVAATDDSVNVNDFMTMMDKYLDDIVVHKAISAKLQKACAGTDIAGYNYMTARYALDAKEHPNRIIVGSETYPPEIARNWREVQKYPTVIGDFTWTGWDYIGEAGVGIPAYQWGEGGFGAQFPAKLAYSGDIDITGFRRPVSYYREIVFGLRKAPYIAVQNPARYGELLIKTPWVMSDAISSWTYPGFEGKPVVVEVYTAGDEVALYCNEKLIEKRTVSEKDNCRVLFETTYTAGTLKAVSYEKGNIIGECVLATAEGEPQLHTFAEPSGSEEGLVFMPVVLEDKSGTVFTSSSARLTFEIVSGGELVGFGSGNPKSQDPYDGTETALWNGRALAVLRRSGTEKIRYRIISDTGLRLEGEV